MRHSLVSLAVLASLACPAAAQRLAPVWVPPPVLAYASVPVTQSLADSVDHSADRLLGGLLGATAGFLAGGVVGAGIERSTSRPCQDFCGLGGFILGATFGESVGVVGGMAVAGPGSRPVDLLISTGIAVAGIAAAAAANRGLVLVAVPIAQFAILLRPHFRTARAPSN